MNYTYYSEDIQQLMDEARRYSVERKKGALRKLQQLKNIGNELDDSGLLGFTYYYIANWYFDHYQYDLFHENIKKAIHELLRSNEQELLARSYNLFGIYAERNDMIDVAYNYYMSALQFLEENSNSPVRGIVYGNVANIYYAMGEYNQSRLYNKRSKQFIDKNKKDLLYPRNNLIAYTTEGLDYLGTHNITAAEKAYKKAERVYQKTDKEILQDALLPYKFFETRLTLAQKNYVLVKEQLSQIIEILKEEDAFEYIPDIGSFCKAMMETRYKKEVGKIIEVIEDNVRATGVIHALRILSEIKVEYDELTHDGKALEKDLLEYHSLRLSQREEERKIYKYSIELVKLIDDLREEDIRVRLENENLQIQVLTDPLTKIPNRHALDVEVIQRFESAYKNQQNLGIEIMDVNDFKAFNDRYGHQVGDQCLEMIAKILHNLSKEENFYCARYGGDEFAIIYEGLNNKEIEAITKKIAEMIHDATMEVKGKRIREHITVSQGVCNSEPRLKSKTWDYLSEADVALYEAKEEYKKSGLDLYVPIHELPKF